MPALAAAEIEAAVRRAAAAHKHPCPRQVLGVRMGLQAAELLGLEVPQADKRLLAFVETDGCFADGVSAATGCTLGHRTMRLMDEGKVAATFVDTITEKAVRISPAPDCRTLAVAYAPNAPNRWRAQMDAYAVMPASELLCVREVKLLIDLKAMIGRPGVRVNCMRCGEEVLNGREVLRDGTALCRGCAMGSYAEVAPE